MPPFSSVLFTGGTDDTWSHANDVPFEREKHQAVWTGSEMIVWGGYSDYYSQYLDTGAKYNPSTDVWTPITTTNAPAGRVYFTAVWTGTYMIVWGGLNDSALDTGGNIALNTGGLYSPANDSWTPTDTYDPDCPSIRYRHTAVWDDANEYMIIWGGRCALCTPQYRNDGGRYRPPPYNDWLWVETDGAPEARAWHTAVMASNAETPVMIVWGGMTRVGEVKTGGRYDPVDNEWYATDIQDSDCPDERMTHTAVWDDSGERMIIWGGGKSGSPPTYYGDGGMYYPDSNYWDSVNDSGAPDARSVHTAVWTGSAMIVWGGWGGSWYFNTGGRYTPSTNSWQSTTTTGAPEGRVYQTAV